MRIEIGKPKSTRKRTERTNSFRYEDPGFQYVSKKIHTVLALASHAALFDDDRLHLPTRLFSDKITGHDY